VVTLINMAGLTSSAPQRKELMSKAILLLATMSLAIVLAAGAAGAIT